MTRIFWLFILFHVSYEQGCDFEKSCASLQIDKYWGETSGEVPFSPDAPSQDHTYQNSSGHYIFFDLKSVSTYTNSIIKFNDFFNLTEEQSTKCLKFYYIFDSNYQVNLNVKLIMGDLSEVKSTWLTINSFTNSTKNWTLAELRLPNDAYWIQIELDLSKYIPSRVLLTLDDIFISTECSVKTPQPRNKVLYWCDFESNNCDLENTMRLEWKRLKALDSQDQSPKKDHTTNTENGHYLSSSKLTDSNSAYIERVISPPITIPDDGIPYCLSFYYNTQLNLEKQATIYISVIHLNSTDSENQLNNEIWSNYKQIKYNEWLWGITNLVPGEIKLGFLVTNNQNREISAAIDDIKIHSCFSVNYPKVYGDYSDYYFEYKCNFDRDLCGFSKSCINLNSEYPSNWTRIKPENNIYPSLGPSVDHTTQSNTSYYLAVNFSLPLRSNFEARTQSKPIFTHSEMCIEFYYYANTEMFSLNSQSFFGLTIGGCYATTLNLNYAFQNYSEPQWTRVVVQLNSYACRNYLIFYFKGADIIKKSFAIDDFRVYRCDRIDPITTTTVTTSTTTSKTLVTTTQNTTIPISQTTIETTTTSKESSSTTKYITETTQEISTSTTSLKLNSTQHDKNNSKLVKSDLFLPFL
ncbi:unnamed protein product, partial [Brachionus calyciflorus]